jgi:phosphoribosylformylglycinamidine synthase
MKQEEMIIVKGEQVYYFVEIKGNDFNQDLIKVLKGKVVKLDDISESVVLPRRGTTSPWSSKAAELLLIFNFPVGKIWKGLVKTDFDALLEESVSDLQLYFSNLKVHKKELKFLNWKTLDKENGLNLLFKMNADLGLALSLEEMEYLYLNFKKNLSDAELLMFSQVNSEHCRHKIFNATWEINKERMDFSLFQMIRNTYNRNSAKILSAYSDNAAVLEGEEGVNFFTSPNSDRVYSKIKEKIHFVIKVETHNHPTAVSPFPGAATGSGGEIRDEGM